MCAHRGACTRSETSRFLELQAVGTEFWVELLTVAPSTPTSYLFVLYTVVMREPEGTGIDRFTEIPLRTAENPVNKFFKELFLNSVLECVP